MLRLASPYRAARLTQTHRKRLERGTDDERGRPTYIGWGAGKATHAPRDFFVLVLGGTRRASAEPLCGLGLCRISLPRVCAPDFLPGGCLASPGEICSYRATCRRRSISGDRLASEPKRALFRPLLARAWGGRTSIPLESSATQRKPRSGSLRPTRMHD